MKFKINKFENKDLGEQLNIKEISKSEFDNVIKLIEKLGLKRNLKVEKEIKKFAEKNNLNDKEAIYRNYKGKNNEAEVEYKTKLNICSIRLKSNKITAEEIIKQISENQ